MLRITPSQYETDTEQPARQIRTILLETAGIINMLNGYSLLVEEPKDDIVTAHQANERMFNPMLMYMESKGAPSLSSKIKSGDVDNDKMIRFARLLDQLMRSVVRLVWKMADIVLNINPSMKQMGILKNDC